MGIIRPLDEHLANQIAAGEVVERPASVLKELIENAVDAGSSRIDVVAEEGGLTLLRITDDGAGIQSDDMLLAFQRHATSKISAAKDLFQISTLGFRGEALPSIAAVAKIRCVSATDNGGLARIVEIEGGAIRKDGETNAPQGTEMTVRDLFFNTPARLKYMKTVQTELGHLSDIVYRQALAHPNIAFTFQHNGSTLLRTPGNGDLRQVVAAIYGSSAAKSMVEIQGSDPDYSLSGLTALPVETRANRNAVTVLVNGRYVRSQAVMQPLLQAYHTLLPVHRFPLSVIHLRMHPSLLDVNVHPAKLEVRFSKEAELRAFVEETVKRALSAQAYIPSASSSVSRAAKPQTWTQEQIRFQLPPAGEQEATAAAGYANSVPNAAAPIAGQHGKLPGIGESSAPYEARSLEGLAEQRGDLRTDSRTDFRADPRTDSRADFRADPRGGPTNGQRFDSRADYRSAALPGTPVPEHVWQAAFEPPASAPAKPSFPELSWIGQLHGTYIVAQNENGLYLIDQHAAHERINYEYYYEKFGKPEEASQELLLPVTLEFAPDEHAVIRDRIASFESAGVYLEEFGGNTFIVRAVPHWFPEGDEADIVRDMAEWVLRERKVDLHALREKAAIMCSCKASIKANQSQSREAGEKLLERLGACSQPYTCPHGRPIVVSFSTYELEKMFKRVM